MLIAITRIWVTRTEKLQNGEWTQKIYKQMKQHKLSALVQHNSETGNIIKF